MNGIKNVMNSLGGVVVGCFVFCGALFLLGWNEGRAVKTAQTINEARKAFVQLDCTADPMNNGKLVSIRGCRPKANPEQMSIDGFLEGVAPSADASLMFDEATQGTVIQWNRKTQQYVQVETRANDTTTYDPMWADSQQTWTGRSVQPQRWPVKWKPISELTSVVCLSLPDQLNGSCELTTSTAFQLRTGQNSPSWQWTTVKGFGTSDPVSVNLQATDVSLSNVPTQSPELAKANACGGRYLQTQKGSCALPALASQVDTTGDFRWSWTRRVINPGTVVSGMAQQVSLGGGAIGFVEWQNPKRSSCSYCTIANFYEEDMSGDDILDRLESENEALTWVLRFVGWLLVWLACWLFAAPIAAVPTLIPFIGDFLGEVVGTILLCITCVASVAVAMLVIGIAWLVFRPLLGLGLLCVTVAGAVGVGYFLNAHKKKKKAAGQATEAAPLQPYSGSSPQHNVQMFPQAQQAPPAYPPTGTAYPPGTVYPPNPYGQ